MPNTLGYLDTTQIFWAPWIVRCHTFNGIMLPLARSVGTCCGLLDCFAEVCIKVSNLLPLYPYLNTLYDSKVKWQAGSS